MRETNLFKETQSYSQMNEKVFKNEGKKIGKIIGNVIQKSKTNLYQRSLETNDHSLQEEEI